ncbi:uncharacterized protein LOC123430191 [Hordeum vulgare subsp. vulgare]|uniref:uncharacterized protein LOC123430191 n=1 Tax=Hordeum vulgare subsp. vulgare TaxID=112509 RepID=UPI001D1A3F18|nr:uncharacterized protein LOC123430191 [Hordeum vulgare subsp. vulgare]
MSNICRRAAAKRKGSRGMRWEAVGRGEVWCDPAAAARRPTTRDRGFEGALLSRDWRSSGVKRKRITWSSSGADALEDSMVFPWRLAHLAAALCCRPSLLQAPPLPLSYSLQAGLPRSPPQAKVSDNMDSTL